MAEYDLTKTLASCLDRHLVFPLLEFLEEKKIHPEQEILAGKLALLSKTNMVDFAMAIYKKLHGTEQVPEDMVARRATILSKMASLRQACAPLLDLLENPAKEELLRQLKSEKLFNAQHLKDNFNITEDHIENLYFFAKFNFDCGGYIFSSKCLQHYRLLSNDPERCFYALWGKLACDILMHDWETSLDDLDRLREFIDAQTPQVPVGTLKFTPLVQLQQRSWLLHWSLFVYFNHPNGRNGIIELFGNEKYLNVIQTTCPHLLRYLTTAVITNKRKRSSLKDLVRVISQESYTYRDPITEFLECLYVHYDFEAAQQKLRECERVLANDFFLVACRDEFIENARLFIFETYCRIHQRIDIGMLADKLNMTAEAAEKWIVNLIRNARLDAKIDSAKNQVIMGTQYPTIYQQVIEKTKGLSFRTYVLSNNIQKLGL